MTTLNLPPPRIALIGECMIELQQHADGSLHQSFGGDTLNTAFYLSRELGGRASVDYVTALGDDSFSDSMCRIWREEALAWTLCNACQGACPVCTVSRPTPRESDVFSTGATKRPCATVSPRRQPLWCWRR